MKKSKELSNNKKPKFKIIIFYGPFAVGKYTVAKEFQEKTGYKLFHNHHTYDIARELFDRGTLHIDRLTEKLRFDIIEEIAKAKINVVMTHAYSTGYVSKTGISDPAYMKRIENIIKKAGGESCFVHLMADSGVLLKRVSGNSRNKFKKLKDVEVMKNLLKSKEENKDWVTPAPVKNNLEINNSKLSPKKVADMVIKHFKIRA